MRDGIEERHCTDVARAALAIINITLTVFGGLMGGALKERVKLTAGAKAVGCAAKLNPATLDAMLNKLPSQANANVLVGFETSDDAGIYRVNEQLAVAQTVDFFTPIVDEPQTFGEIAAANALSDIYAMGGNPISALSIVAFPEHGDFEVLEEILRGGLAKMAEANCVVIGGHSIRSEEILFGYAVTGLIDPRRIWRNVGARTGDALLFTKPLGTGVITTALKNGAATEESLKAAVTAMTTLNGGATAALRELEESAPGTRPIHAVTDVTGFGLLGHAREMALGSRASETTPDTDSRTGTLIPPVSLEIDHSAFAYLPGAARAALDGHLSGGLKNNRAFVGDCVEFTSGVAPEYRSLLFDPQTSGGLLIAVAEQFAAVALANLQRHGIAARSVGRIMEKRSPPLSVH
jgi:selenide,water dikinase